jgi:hypothetical protein
MSLEQYVPRAEVALSNAQDVAVHRLGEWAQSAGAAHQIAQTLVQTSFVPDSFRNKPGEATAAILAGLEVGLQPMAALRSFDVIQGQAAPRAVTLRAIVQSNGHEMVLVESTATRCRMKGLRKGSQEWQTVTWTIERARDLGVTGKSNWKNQPQAMLVARATSELARLIASDAILGIAYSAEEINDGGTVDQQVATETTAEPTPGGTRRMSRRPATIAEQVPQSGDSAGSPAETSVTEGEAGSTPAGNPPESPLLNVRSAIAKAMYAGINEAGIQEAERIDWICNVIGRDIDSTKEMTEDEARVVLDTLAARKAELDADPVAAAEGGGES